MNVTNVGAATTTPDQMQSLADTLGPMTLGMAMDQINQGAKQVSGLDQAFGDESPAKKAMNVELA